MTQINKTDPTREAVKAFYGERARSSSSCCQPEESFYSTNDIELMPSDVSGFSLGCGNAVGAAALQPGETVLDLGSGGGLECFIAAREVGRQGHVIGIDMTHDMLSRARAAAERMAFENVEFREGLIESLPVDSESIDVIISNCVINLSTDKLAVFREMYRVLKPGGRLAISDVVTNAPIAQQYQQDMELWSACASGAVAVSEWTEELKKLGFVDVEIKAIDDNDEFADLIPESRPFSAVIRAVKSN